MKQGPPWKYNHLPEISNDARLSVVLAGNGINLPFSE